MKYLLILALFFVMAGCQKTEKSKPSSNTPAVEQVQETDLIKVEEELDSAEAELNRALQELQGEQ